MVLRAPLVDLPKMTAVPAGLALVVSFLEVPPGDNVPTSKALYAEASPQTHVSAKTPPTLLMHGDADDLVPYSQSAGYEAALRAAGVPTKLITVPGGKHGADFGFAPPKPGWPNYFDEAVKWFDQYLKVTARSGPGALLRSGPTRTRPSSLPDGSANWKRRPPGS